MHFANEGFPVFACSRSKPRFDIPENVEWASFDLCDTSILRDSIQSFRPTDIINTAAITSVDYAEQHKEETWKINVEAVKGLATECHLNNIRLLHYSTDFVFNGTKGMYSEKDSPKPLSYYGKSKLSSEKIVLQNKNSIVIRTVLVYGYLKSMSRSNFVLWVKENLQNGKGLSVTADQYRTPTLVEDLAKAKVKLVKSDVSGILHLAGPEYLSVYDFAQSISRHFNLDQSLISAVFTHQMDQIGKRPMKTGFELGKAKKLIGYEPRNIAEGLKLMEGQIEK